MYSNKSPPTVPAGMESPYISTPGRCGIAPSTGMSLSRRYSSIPESREDVVIEAWLAERERERLNTRIKEFNLKNHVFDRPFLTDELIHSRLLNLAQAIGAGIGSMIVAGC